MSEARSRAREAIDMTNDSRQAGAMETFIDSPDGAYLDAVKEKAREIDAQLAAEQAASCRLREALERQIASCDGNCTMCEEAHSVLTAAPGPCVHQQRAEARVRELDTAVYWIRNGLYAKAIEELGKCKAALADAGAGGGA